jgi:hypothetical protein
MDQMRDFLQTEHGRQPAPVLGIGQEITELVAPESLDEKESQSRYTIDHGAGTTKFTKDRTPAGYCRFSYSALASLRMGMSGSASFHSVKKSW